MFNINQDNINNAILYCLLESDKYGYEIVKSIQEISENKYELKQATLYNLLKKLQSSKFITSYWQDSDIGGKRHYYSLTEKGKNNANIFLSENSLLNNNNHSNIVDNKDKNENYQDENNINDITECEEIIDENNDIQDDIDDINEEITISEDIEKDDKELNTDQEIDAHSKYDSYNNESFNSYENHLQEDEFKGRDNTIFNSIELSNNDENIDAINFEKNLDETTNNDNEINQINSSNLDKIDSSNNSADNVRSIENYEIDLTNNNEQSYKTNSIEKSLNLNLDQINFDDKTKTYENDSVVINQNELKPKIEKAEYFDKFEQSKNKRAYFYTQENSNINNSTNKASNSLKSLSPTSNVKKEYVDDMPRIVKPDIISSTYLFNKKNQSNVNIKSHNDIDYKNLLGELLSDNKNNEPQTVEQPSNEQKTLSTYKSDNTFSSLNIAVSKYNNYNDVDLTDKKYLKVNKRNFIVSLILFTFSLISLITTYFLLKSFDCVTTYDIPFIVYISIESFFLLIMSGIYIYNPLKKLSRKENYKYKCYLSIIINLIFMIVIISFNLLFGMNALNIMSYSVFWLVLIVLSLQITLYPILCYLFSKNKSYYN